MNDLRLYAQGSICYEQFRVVPDRNDSRSWVLGFRCYEQGRAIRYEQLKVPWAYGSRFYGQFRAMNDMNDFGSWVQGFKCYEKLKVVDDIWFVPNNVQIDSVFRRDLSTKFINLIHHILG